MPIWLEDVIQQLSLARILRDSDVVPGKRIAMILVDNVVEFLIKVHGDDIILGKILNKAEWEKKKRYFEDLVNLVLPKTKASTLIQDILDFHDVRNSLYHGTDPLSVDATKINEYIRIAEALLEKIFSIQMSQDLWNTKVETTTAKITPSSTKGSFVTFSKISGDAVRFEAIGRVMDRHAIMLVLHGFGVQYGYSPSYDQLVKSLNHSAHQIKKSTLSNHLSYLRAKGWVKRDDYSLTAQGRKWLESKFGLL